MRHVCCMRRNPPLRSEIRHPVLAGTSLPAPEAKAQGWGAKTPGRMSSTTSRCSSISHANVRGTACCYPLPRVRAAPGAGMQLAEDVFRNALSCRGHCPWCHGPRAIALHRRAEPVSALCAPGPAHHLLCCTFRSSRPGRMPMPFLRLMLGAPHSRSQLLIAAPDEAGLGQPCGRKPFRSRQQPAP